MSILDGKVKTFGRATALAVMLGLAMTGPAMAQQDEATEVADAVTDTAEEADDGFDDWGLLGLLGLAGLAGLRARQSRVVEPARTERVDATRR